MPVLIEADGSAVSGSDAICEFLDELQPEPSIIGRGALVRAEVRRLVYWFDHRFNDEVTENLVGEKIMKRFLGLGEPDSRKVRAGYANIHNHLNYITYLTERRRWLGGDDVSLADITASAHISTIDYLGDVPWSAHEDAKDWYSRIKSRASFQPLLSDQIPGLTPARCYTDLNF